jgi:GT2 family glycosyltransferase
MKIPVYFNYVGKYPDLLERAIKSIPEEYEVRVNSPGVKPFTQCLNDILNSVETPIWFFMHYDAEILDTSIFQKMIDLYEKTPNAAAVCSSEITDLFILFDTKKIKSIGGWDEGFKNSYMEIDLRERIYNAGLTQPILYFPSLCPPEINHTDASKLRDPKDSENNLNNVYIKTFEEDYLYFKEKYKDHPMSKQMPPLDEMLKGLRGEK